MSTGKYLSLEEARNSEQLDRFAKEHPSQGEKEAFDDLLDRMARNLPVDEQTSEKD